MTSHIIVSTKQLPLSEHSELLVDLVWWDPRSTSGPERATDNEGVAYSISLCVRGHHNLFGSGYQKQRLHLCFLWTSGGGDSIVCPVLPLLCRAAETRDGK